MKGFSATEVANFSICGKTLQELLSQLAEQGLNADKAQEAAVLLAQELMRQGVTFRGGSGGQNEEAALAAQISRSLMDGHGITASGPRRKRFTEMVESAVDVMKTQRRAGAAVDHDSLTPSQGGAPVVRMGDEVEQAAKKKTVARRRPKGGRAR